MPSISSIVDPTVFNSYAACVAILVLKMIGVGFWTVRTRFAKKVFANPEDAKGKGEAKVKFDDADVERVRRAHLNDLENIPIFFAVGLAYMFVGPAASTAIWHFRIFTISRVIHSFVYIGQVPQPSRALAYGGGLVVTVSMAVQILLKVCISSV